MRTMTHRYMVVIDDLELDESLMVANFLKNAITNGDLELAIQDCISVANEIDFHKYKPNQDERNQALQYDTDLGQIPCDQCNRLKSDTIHKIEYVEIE